MAKMTESFKQQLQELVDQAAEKEYPDIMGISQGSYRATFKQGCEFLMPLLMKAVEQRDHWAEYAGAYLIEKHIPRDNKELLNILKGETK